ncbi:hypothetical protein QC762_0086840 [Podospora pseudocomata]|uniref:Uncharacterized protein n=1 Tax=Podospora pseudocomata TaxID=2093779 RepID=A0ABR0GDL7_9PEZI|nr:hypothetical protein QC762_0086840 [Podospora pseudocomata]
MCRQKVNQHCSQLVTIFLDIFFYSPNLLSPRSTVRVPNDVAQQNFTEELCITECWQNDYGI